MTPENGIPGTVTAKPLYKAGRRPRVPLSCDPCRTRKLKCNREEPCQNCTARDERATCRYKGSTRNGTYQNQLVDPMQQRIDHLESLVKSFLSQRQEPSPIDVLSSRESPGPGAEPVLPVVKGDISDVEYSTGTTVFDGVHSVYKGVDDWYDVLKEINKLKQVWSKTQVNQNELKELPDLSDPIDGSGLLFGQVKQIEIFEILATFPPKPEIDRLLRHFFDRESFPITVAPIIHEATFMREYTEHWKVPSQTNIIWLGLLFSILGIVMLSYHQFEEPPEYEGISESLFQLYRLRTAQCLMVGDIGKCLPYTLETLRFNATAELNRKDDNSRGLWIMSGVIVRAAINMGYHRDPASLPVSILQAEYRRRVWFSVIGMDDVASFRVGFPRMMSAIYSNTLEPRNLHDWELSDDINVLPPSRPLTEQTPVTYLIVKGRLFCALGLITDFNNRPSLGPYDTVLEIDNSLYRAYQNIPQHMKIRSTKGSLKDKSDISSFQLETMYHQGMCTLHRRYMVKGRLDPRYELSQERCISSALALLSYQYILEPSWYQFAQTRQMFTLAAMILFLELEDRRRSPDADASAGSDTLVQALERSCALWDVAKSSCDEAFRVYQILVNMLSSFQHVAGTSSTEMNETLESPVRAYALSPQLQPMLGNFPLEKDLFLTSNDMDFDWATWDAFIEGANITEVESL